MELGGTGMRVYRRDFLKRSLITLSSLAVLPFVSVSGEPTLDGTAASQMRVKLVLTHINIQGTTDSFLTGGKDELHCDVAVLDTPPQLPGPSQYKCCMNTLASVDLGSWGRTGSAQRINRVIYDGELRSRWNTGWGLSVFISDIDDVSPPDPIGSIDIDCRGAAPVYRPREHTRAFGETIPGSQDFQMTGSGARQSYWFSCTITR